MPSGKILAQYYIKAEYGVGGEACDMPCQSAVIFHHPYELGSKFTKIASQSAKAQKLTLDEAVF